MKSPFLCLLFFICCFPPVYGGSSDSLWQVYKKPGLSDSMRLQALHDVAWSYVNNNPDSAILLAEQEVSMAQQLHRRIIEGIAYNTIGVAYKNKCNYPKSLEFNLKALKIAEELHANGDIGNCYINIGLDYYYVNNFQKSLEYLQKAVPLSQGASRRINLINCYLDIGNVYWAQSKFTEARENYEKVLKLALEIKDKNSIGNAYNNLGNVLFFQNKFKEALGYYQKSLEVQREDRNKQGIGECYINMGSVYNSLKDYKLALIYADSVLQVSKEIGEKNLMRYAYETYSLAYAGDGKYKQAYEAEVRFKQITDSLFNTENSRQLSDLKTKFEVEKKELELKQKAITQEAINQEEKKRVLFVTYGVVGLLLLVFVFAIIMFNRFRMTRRQKHIIEKQKDLVEEKQKEIVDSITYARRLQQAILPPEEEIKKHFPESFLLYKPKDIVAGDFYWMYAQGDYLFIAAADCTGHGVPGAMVSVVCSNALNSAVKEFHLTLPGEILDKTRELVLETFAKSTSDVKDGMDISLLAINREESTITWSGANNPLWYISEGKLNVITADKQPIGKTDNPRAFTTHRLKINPGDQYYLITDGYADQFGGEKGKKFKYKQLEELLLAHHAEPAEQQKEKLAESFERWKGSLEQVDDVTVIGLEI